MSPDGLNNMGYAPTIAVGIMYLGDIFCTAYETVTDGDEPPHPSPDLWTTGRRRRGTRLNGQVATGNAPGGTMTVAVPAVAGRL